MSEPDLALSALQAFDQMVASTPGFGSRPGQRQMAQHIAATLQHATLGEQAEPRRAIAVVQAGTGVGKSAAYLSTCLALARARKTRLVISTATVALQEQLISKDLPALAATLDTPLVFALAKGRGRYVCRLKLERLAGSDDGADLFDPDDELPQALGAGPARFGPRGADPLVQRATLYRNLAQTLATGRWDGDRDSLSDPPEPRDWAPVAAERHTCTGRHCPLFGGCSYYLARTQLAQAQVIVANHDLVLASLGRRTLPELDRCLWVFDEGHHLPAVALNQFSSVMDLSSLRWLDRLPGIVREVADKLGVAVVQDVSALAQQLKAAMQDAARLALDLLRPDPAQMPLMQQVYRFREGVLVEPLIPVLTRVQGHAQGLTEVLEALGAELKSRAKEEPARAAAHAASYAMLGQMAPRLGSVCSTCDLLLASDGRPLAKWLASEVQGGSVQLSAHACPILAGELLHQHVWQPMRAAVITSATLASCGSFDYFLGEAGLDLLDQVATLAVASPFDYPRQGQLLVVQTRSDPHQADAYTREVVTVLLADLRQVLHGALVLFTSRVQMQAAVSALEGDLRERVLVQGQSSRARLLKAHRARVEAGLPSVIFGMQSFGEGLDLPGALCETVFIIKLPFASPADPVEEARAEWLKRQGRDPFADWVVPATGIRLLQWTGRAIRHESDQARVVCYDRRLLDTGYGRRLLLGLPAYRLLRRAGERILPVSGAG